MIGLQAIHIVAVTRDGRTEYWAAATARLHGVSEVKKRVPASAQVALHRRFLSVRSIANLKLAPGSIGRLTDESHLREIE